MRTRHIKVDTLTKRGDMKRTKSDKVLDYAGYGEDMEECMSNLEEEFREHISDAIGEAVWPEDKDLAGISAVCEDVTTYTHNLTIDELPCHTNSLATQDLPYTVSTRTRPEDIQNMRSTSTTDWYKELSNLEERTKLLEERIKEGWKKEPEKVLAVVTEEAYNNGIKQICLDTTTIIKLGDTNMSNTTTTGRKLVTIVLMDNDKNIPDSMAIVAKFEDVICHGNQQATLAQLLLERDIKGALAEHNVKRSKQVDEAILARTGNEVKLREIDFHQLEIQFKG